MKDSFLITKNYKLDESRQRWLMIFRLVSTTFLFVVLTIMKLKNSGGSYLIIDWYPIALFILGFNYLFISLYHFTFQKIFSSFTQIAIQMLGDLWFSTSIVLITGGGYSTISFIFILCIINIAFLAGLKAALISASLVSLVWGGMINLQDYDFFSWLIKPKTVISPSEQLIIILFNTGACYLVAFLGGYLSSQLEISKNALVKSQNRFEKLEELNENIIQSVDYGLITSDYDGKVTSMNSLAESLLGLQVSKNKKLSIYDIFPKKFFIEGDLNNFQHNPNSSLIKFKKNSIQSEIFLELTVSDLKDKYGKIWGRLLTFRDITNKLNMEAEIKKAEHLTALGELAAGIAHEIRTPLASMTGSWHLLTSHSLPENDEERLMQIIGREMERLAQLVTNFLDFAKPPAAFPQAINLKELLNDQIRIFKYQKVENNNFSLITDINDLPDVYFDQDQLTQVIWNLLQNSIEAVKNIENPEIKILTYVDPLTPNQVTISFKNNGPIITEEVKSKIFEPFFTTKTTGSGLGLSIVARILHNGNAKIKLESSVDKGTTFYIILPKAPLENYN